MTTCSYFGGYWSTNIGNAFYDLGVLHVFESLMGRNKISFFQDSLTHYGIPYRRYLNKILPRASSLLCDYSFNYFESIDSEYFIFSGPIFSRSFPKLLPFFERIKSLGKKIIFLSAGGYTYDPSEISIVRQALSALKPYTFISRDSTAYNAYKDLFVHSYDGICFAFFANDYYPCSRIISPHPFVVLNFDRGRDFLISPFSHLDEDNKVQLSPYSSSAKRSFSSGFSSTLHNHNIIRTNHVFAKNDPFLIYKKNIVIADTPYLYLDLYKSSALTLSERVHACVPSLAFGSRAMLFSKSPRSRLFDRIGLSTITSAPATVNQEVLELEKSNMINFISSIL